MKNHGRFMKFIGGRDLIFTLSVLILIGFTILVYNKISFIFHPIIVIFSTVTPPVILAFIAYYLMNPIVNLFERLHIKRIWGIIIIIVVLSGLFTGVILVSAPAIQAQINELITRFPKYLMQMADGLKATIDHSFLGPYYDDGYEWVTSTLADIPSIISDYFGETFTGIINFASTLTNVMVAILTFPIILFFLLKDGARFKEFCLSLLPPKLRREANKVLVNMDVQVGSYIQGQIIVASCIGVLLFIGYLIIGLDYAITLAIIAAITSVVPYLGPIIAISPAVIIAIVHSPFMLLKLAIVWAAVQFLEGNFISPNVMGRTMQIHPLTIIIVLLVGGNLFGLVGVILGIPGYAIMKVLIVHFFDKFKLRYNYYYGKDHGEYESQTNDK
ncbi:MAG TPA: AI-2E family transporter [Virgibacillus sp.]|nr:AI-2E family transporter [Virgibacillus sp.]